MTKAQRILVQATTRAGGDLNPLVALALGLREAGHELTVLCDPPSEPLFARFGMKTVISGPEYEVGSTVKAALKDSQGMPNEERAAIVAEHVAEWSAQLAPSAGKLLAQTRPDIVLTSFFGTCIGSQLHRMSGVPWVALNSTFYIGPNPPRPMSRDFSERAADVFRYSVMPYLAEATLVLHATDPVFDYDLRGIPHNHRYTGPLFWEAPGVVPNYIYEQGEPWTLCTLSSLKQDDTPIAATTLSALSHTRHRLAITVGPVHVVEEVTHTPLPPNSHVEQYVPHSAILERARLLVSHAGHGSVMKSLLYGVPMVLVPWSRDQFGVAARAESMGAALVVPKETLTTHVMAEAIDKVRNEPEYKWAAEEAAMRLRNTRPLEAALEMLNF